jgi:hypothetical protein
MAAGLDWGFNVIAVAGILISLGIASFQKHLSTQQDRILKAHQELLKKHKGLSDSFGLLEVREKLGPIQAHCLALRTGTRQFEASGRELLGHLGHLLSADRVSQRLPADGTAIGEMIRERLNIALSDLDGSSFRDLVSSLQSSDDQVRTDFDDLDKAIERLQNAGAVPGPADQRLLQGSRKYLRGLVTTAQDLAAHSALLLTDCRAVAAVFEHANTESKDELRELVHDFIADPLGRLPCPPTYRGDKHRGRSLDQVLKLEVIDPLVENKLISIDSPFMTMFDQETRKPAHP